jgi:hypothetical protein
MGREVFVALSGSLLSFIHSGIIVSYVPCYPIIPETVREGKGRIRHGRDNDVKMSLFTKK